MPIKQPSLRFHSCQDFSFSYNKGATGSSCSSLITKGTSEVDARVGSSLISKSSFMFKVIRLTQQLTRNKFLLCSCHMTNGSLSSSVIRGLLGCCSKKFKKFVMRVNKFIYDWGCKTPGFLFKWFKKLLNCIAD